MAQNWWEQDEVVGSSPAPQQAPGVIYGRPKQPDPYQVGKDQFDQGLKARDQQLQEDAARRDKTEWDASHNPDGSKKIDPNAPVSATQLEIQTKKDSAERRGATIRSIMGRVHNLYTQDIKDSVVQGGFGGTGLSLPTETNQRFEAAGMAMLPLIRPLVAQTAKEGDSDKEMQVFMSYIPTAGDADSTIEEKLNLLEVLIGGMVDGKPPTKTAEEVFRAQQEAGDKPYALGGSQTYETRQPPPNDDGPDPIIQSLRYGVGDVVEGAGNLAGLVTNPLNTVVNNILGTSLTEDMGGYLREQTGIERGGSSLARAVNMAGVGAFIPGAAASQVRNAPAAAEAVINALAQQPIAQGIAGMASGGASEIARQEGAGPVAQAAAGLAGGLAGFGGANALARTAQRAGNAPNALLRAADRQGVNMLPADVGGVATRRVTSAAAQAPVSASPVINAGKRTQDQLSQAANRSARSQGDIMAGDEVGQQVRQAGELYIKSETQRIGNLYTRAQSAAKGVKIKPMGAVREIDSQVARLSELGETNAPLINSLKKLRADIEGGISVQGLRDARTSLSQGVYDGKLRSSQEKAMYRDILNAVSNDIETGLRSVGREGAAQTFKRADALWRERIAQIDEVLEPIIGKGKSGEDILSGLEAMTRGQKGGIVRLNRLLREMPKEQSGNVRATLIDRLGKASAGQQDETGQAFSAASFLTNWNKMSPKAKNAVFGSDGNLRQNLDDIAKLAASIKEAASYANRSNTAGATLGNVGGIIGVGAATSPQIAAVALGSQYVTGRLLASPAFARWLAKAPQQPSPGYVQRLSVIASQEPQIANDARALQQHLMETFAQSPSRAAAGEKEKQARPVPPANR